MRNQMLDLIKSFGCIGVVFIHIMFPGEFGEIIKSISSYAVPVFFMITGYYAYGMDDKTIKRRLIKIIKIFIFAYILFMFSDVSVAFKNHQIGEWVKNNYNIVSVIKCIFFCTIGFAVPLWYLVAQIETYVFWYVIVKTKKEDIAMRVMPLLFVLYVSITTFCTTMGYDWFWKVNFLTCSLSWYLLGYYLHTLPEEFINKISFGDIIVCGLIGVAIVLLPTIYVMKCNFSSFGHIPYATSIFLIALKYNKSVCFFLEFIGKKLSLWIYIFHVPISMVIKMFAKVILGVDIESMLYMWIHPLITVLVVICISYVFDRLVCFLQALIT